MPDLMQRSRDHLDNLDETYWQHLGFALRHVVMLIGVIFRLTIHAIVPGWFEFGSSQRLERITASLQRKPQPVVHEDLPLPSEVRQTA